MSLVSVLQCECHVHIQNNKLSHCRKKYHIPISILLSVMAEVTSFDRSLTEEKLHDAEQRLRKSLQQILVIDTQIRELEILYKRAQKSKKNASRYNLRLKLSVVSGIKMMYHHYSSSKKEEINRLRTQLFGDDYQLGNNRNEQM